MSHFFPLVDEKKGLCLPNHLITTAKSWVFMMVFIIGRLDEKKNSPPWAAPRWRRHRDPHSTSSFHTWTEWCASLFFASATNGSLPNCYISIYIYICITIIYIYRYVYIITIYCLQLFLSCFEKYRTMCCLFNGCALQGTRGNHGSDLLPGDVRSAWFIKTFPEFRTRLVDEQMDTNQQQMVGLQRKSH